MVVPISLVITVYNRERFLGAAIESILAQTRGDLELLVWDDGSTDRTLEIAQNYAQQDSRVRVVVAEHQGRSRALKDAIAQTTGRYIGFVDSDDILAPTALEETAAVLDAHPATGLVYTDYLVMNDRGEVKAYGNRCRFAYSPAGLLRQFMTFHFRLIRRTVFDEVGGIDETFDLIEDYELCLRLSEVTQVQRVSKPLYYYRVHRESITQQQKAEQNRLALIAIKQARKRRQKTNSFQVTLPNCTQNLYIATFFKGGWGDLKRVESKPVADVHKSTPCSRLIAFPCQSQPTTYDHTHPKRLQYPKFAHFTQSLLRSLSSFLLAAVPIWGAIGVTPALSQVVSASDSAGTLVNTTGNQFDITGGQTSSNGANLFHSFSQFDLNTGQTANFQSNPTIQNILGRVVSGNASHINGLIQVSGSQANLYLMNPAGIIFGSNASLNVPASFVATTATSIGMGNNWFNAAGTNDYTQLNGTPSGFAFTTSQPGSIVNSGNLTVSAGKDLMLLGSTVVSTGQVNAPSGQIKMAAVPGTSLVRLSQPGSVLSLEVLPPASGSNSPTQWTLPVLSLPQLLTGGGGGNATGLSVNAAGEAVLTGSNVLIENGDVVAKQVTAQEATLTANHNLTLVDSTLTTTGDLNLLAQDTVRVRDSTTSPVIAQAGGKLLVQGNQKIDIYALNHPASGLFSGGDMVLRSTSTVGGDAHYFSGGNFRIETLDGSLGNLFSPDDPVIRATGDVNFASYTGASLHILAGGSVTITGNVTITGADATYGLAENVTLSDGSVLPINGTTQPTLDIRAGTTAFAPAGINGSGLDIFAPGIPGTGGTPTSSNIAIGSITNNGGVVFLTNQYSPNTALPGGSISTGQINAAGSSVTLDARNTVTVGGINTAATVGNSGNVKLLAVNNITTTGLVYSGTTGTGGNGGNILITSRNGAIDTSAGNLDASNIFGTAANAGTITLQAQNNIATSNLYTYAFSQGTGNGNNISLTSTAGAINIIGDINSTSGSAGNSNGGAVNLNAAGDITLAQQVRSFSNGSGNGGNITITSSGGAINTSGAPLQSGLNQGNGGAITLSANGGINTGSLSSASAAGLGTAGTGGAINLSSSNGSIIVTGDLNSSSTGRNGNGNGGSLNLTAANGIAITGNIDSSSFVRNPGGNAGSITLTTANGNITTGNLNSFSLVSFGAGGNGGAITLAAPNGDINIGNLNAVASNQSPGATNTIGTGGAVILNAGNSLSTGTINATTFARSNYGNISLTGNEINFTGGANSVRGNNATLLLQPSTSSQAIAIAGTTDSGTDTLDITTTDLAAIAPGFTSITIGRADSTGTVTLNPFNFNAPVNIAGGSTLVGPNQNTTWTMTGTNAGSISGFPNGLTFSSIENLRGGTANDTFIFTNGGTGQDLTIDAGLGNDSITVNGPLTLTNNLSLSTGSDGGDIAVNNAMNAGSLNLNGTNITTASNGTLTTNGAGGINVIANNLTLNAPVLATGGGVVTATADNNITTGKITANAGIALTSTNGTIDTSAGILDSSSTTGNGGAIALSALGNITTNNITSHSDAGAGGDITLNSQTGAISSGNLDASGNTAGGKISVIAQQQITTGQINSSATTGDGGNVLLDPVGDIQVDSINAQGGTSGKGGTVDITTNQFFRAVGNFSDRNGINASISTAGGTGSGDIIIRHDGGARGIPFIVGDATINGTAGAITTGSANSILPLQSFPGAYTQGNIQLITQNPPPSPKPDTHRVSKDIQGEPLIPQGINTISKSAIVLLNTTDIVRQEIDQAIDSGQIEKAIALVEQLRMQEFQNYYEGNLTSETNQSGSVEQTQAVLTDIATNTGKTPAVIYVFTQPDQLQLILVTPKDKPLLKTVYEANKDTLLETAKKFRSQITEPRNKKGYQATAKQLYQWLIAPLEAELKAKKIDTLVFSMDGGLRSIPLAALYDGQQFLVEKYSIGLIPSINLVDTRYGNVKTSEVLAMGASKFTEQNALPAVPIELSTIVGQQNLGAENWQLLPANQSATTGLWTGKSFLNQSFTLNNLKAQRNQTPFGVIHLATHGEFNLGAPRNSFIQLSDTKLRLDQLRQMGWNHPPVELLVLSACRTALGSQDAEFGFGGLAVAAGVKSAIASLWYVSDEGTLGLITDFYQQLKTAPIKAEALRQAQIAMIKGQVRVEGGKLQGIGQGSSIPLPPELAEVGDEEFSHPYYWSAFTMIGSPW